MQFAQFITPLCAAIVIAGVVFAIKAVLNLRQVVPTNEVHTVQRGRVTTSYGQGYEGGNVYYAWPSWLPMIGLTSRILPTSIFSIKLQGYDAYDKDRVPFIVDVIAFFRITDSNLAAKVVATFQDLEAQLFSIVQGAVRTTLATHDIDEIMTQRAKFGQQFTTEVADQLKAWGIETVKSLELMDIRDAKDHQVVANIMAKKMSHIESESRKTVAANTQAAAIAEIAAKRDVGMQQQEAEQQVGQRTAEKDKQIGIAREIATQDVAEQRKVSKEKEMAIIQVQTVQQATIDRESALIQADREKQTSIINAEAQKRTSVIQAEAQKETSVLKADGEKQMLTLQAEGKLNASLREAEGVEATGKAKASADTALNLAPVTAQITLAKEIGSNEGYQRYLLGKQQVEAGRDVGIEQAKALNKAEIKIIANGSSPADGLGNASSLFGMNTGFSFGSMLEGLTATPMGKKVTDKLGITSRDDGEYN